VSGGDTAPGDRLERALAAFLAAPPTTRAEADRLLEQNPDLAELLEPMLAPDAHAAPGADAASERVLGDFRLVRELGRGGMGIVYEAWQRSLDRRVAVKLLAPALVANPSAVARFHREAASVSRVRHANIVEVIGFGSDGGEHFFAMQYVDGVPLHDAAARFAAPAAAVRLVAQLADALACAHAAGLVHRDVKPANVIVRADGEALLTDFGVARDESLPSLTRDGGFVGTLDYASPEQVRGEPVDARTDVWALGVILYELLAGEHPFTAATQEATMHAILAREPAALRHRGVSDDLAAVVVRTLEKNRLRRYASAAALLADLRALERGEPVSVRLPSGIERVRRWAARNPWRAVAAAVVLVAVPALAGSLGYLWANAPRIEAAAAAERLRQREELLGAALATAHDDAARDGLAMLGPERPDEDLEIVVVRAMLHSGLGEYEEAQRVLAGRTEPVAEFARGLTKVRSVHFDGPLKVPDDPFECFVLAELLMTRYTKLGVTSHTASNRVAALANKAVALAPRPRLSYLITWVLGAENGSDRMAFDAAVQALERHFPDSEVGLVIRARVLARHDPERSLALLDEIERRKPPTNHTQLSRGLAYEQLDRLDEAIAANRRATELDPKNGRAWANLGVTLRKAKRAAESVEALERAVEVEPHKPSNWNALGLSRRDSGDQDGACAAFLRALEAAPDYAAAALNLGVLRARLGDKLGAVDALERAVAGDPTSFAAMTNLAEMLYAVGRTEEAFALALRASQQAPNELPPATLAARFALELHLPTLALQHAERANGIGKNDARAKELLVRALLAQRTVDGPAAVAAARDADVARKGGDVDVRILLAQALAANGDREQAITTLQQAKTKFPAAQAKLDAALGELTKAK
jgi:tetratricopeptide (TPR) repeat protein